MLIPGGFLSGTLFPWVVCAPVLPLLFLLIRKPAMDRTLIGLVLLSTVTILADTFLFMSRGQASLAPAFESTSVFFQFVVSCFLLGAVTADKYLRTAIGAASLVFTAVYLTMSLASGFEPFRTYLVIFGFILLFLFAILALFTLQQSLTRHLNETPEFWIAAGMLFESGLLAFLLMVNTDIKPGSLAPGNGVEVMLAGITWLKFIFFSLGIWQYKSLGSKN
jgi:hypothetical protein